MFLLDSAPVTLGARRETRIHRPSDGRVRWTVQHADAIAATLARVRPDGERPAGLQTEGQLWIAIRAALADVIEATDSGFDRARFFERTQLAS
jgi:hypothetical protein